MNESVVSNEMKYVAVTEKSMIKTTPKRRRDGETGEDTAVVLKGRGSALILSL